MSVLDLAKKLGKELTEWRKKGYATVTKEILDERLKICRDCKWWQEMGNSGIARCRSCGCSSVKLLMATSKCPLNPPRWDADYRSKFPELYDQAHENPPKK